jgi:hypothetical protein
MPKGISASKRAAAEAEAPAPKRLRKLTPSIQEQQADGGNSASSRAEQQAAAQQAAAAAACEQDLVVPASEDDSDVEIIGETPAPDVLVVQPNPQQLAAQRARQQKGKGIAETREPKPDPEGLTDSWQFTEVDFVPLYGLSDQQLAQMKRDAASSSRGVSRQHALIEAFEQHKAQQLEAALQLEQQRAADAAAAAAGDDGLQELDGDSDQAAAAAADDDEDDIVIEDSQPEDDDEQQQQHQQQQQQQQEEERYQGSDADFMPRQQQQQQQPPQPPRERQRQQQGRAADAAAAAAALHRWVHAFYISSCSCRSNCCWLVSVLFAHFLLHQLPLHQPCAVKLYSRVCQTLQLAGSARSIISQQHMCAVSWCIIVPIADAACRKCMQQTVCIPVFCHLRSAQHAVPCMLSGNGLLTASV